MNAIKYLGFIAAAFVWASLSTAAEKSANYTEKLQPTIELLRNEKIGGQSSIGGAAIGFAGTPGLHSKSHAYFMQHATAKDLELMLADSNAAVRIMAAHCVISKGSDGPLLAAAKKLTNDHTRIALMAGGCEVRNSTVGQVIESILKNPKYLLP